MTKVFSARRLDVKGFAEDGATLRGQESVRDHERLMAETQQRGAAAVVDWSASGELRNPGHVQPEIWLHLKGDARMPLTCQRCLGAVDIDVDFERSFRFVADETAAAAEDDESEEDVLELSRSFDLIALIEDEMLMALPLAPRHQHCPETVQLSSADPDFEAAAGRQENPFAVLGKLKSGKS